MSEPSRAPVETRVGAWRVERLATARAVAARAADVVAELLAASPEAACLLPAGGTPRPLFAELLRRHASGSLRARRFAAFQLDEVVGLAPSDPASFHAFLRRELLDPLDREPGRDFLIDGTACDPRAEIERHAARLSELGPPALALLGLGLNGHVAFNEPGSTPADRARRVELDAGTRAAQGGAAEGVTLGLAEILSARRVVLIVTGRPKRDVLARLLASAPAPELPASFLQAHPDALVLADAEALPG